MAAPDHEPQPRGNMLTLSLQLQHIASSQDAGFRDIKERISELRGDMANLDARTTALELWRESSKAREEARIEAERDQAERERIERERASAAVEAEHARRERLLFPLNAVRIIAGLVVLAAGYLAGTQLPN